MKNILILPILLLASVLNTHGQNPTVPSVNFIITNSALNKTANDVAINNVLIKISNGQFTKDDSYLIELIKRGVRDAVLASGEYTNPKAFFQAGTKKAQILISKLTAAYTRAIFRAKSALEARKILSRYQNTIKMIVDFIKEGKFGL